MKLIVEVCLLMCLPVLGFSQNQNLDSDILEVAEELMFSIEEGLGHLDNSEKRKLLRRLERSLEIINGEGAESEARLICTVNHSNTNFYDIRRISNGETFGSRISSLDSCLAQIK